MIPAFAAILEGVRILDCTRNIAGPVSTMLAAEMGADVIKVEPPEGDEMRQWPPFVDGESVYFASCNRGKRSIAIDLKSTDGVALFRRLLKEADVLVENYRPGTLEGFGLGWNDLRAEHPRLVWVSVSGYGRSGPKANAPAYDSMIQAFIGMMGITGEPQGAPVRAGGSPIDIATAYLAWGSIVSGIHSVARTGKGLLLEVSLMETGLGLMHAYLQGVLSGSPMATRMGSETAGIYPLGAFLAGDGEYCLVQVSNQHQWRRFCKVLEMPELVDDPRFATNPQRVTNRDALRPLLQQRLASKGAKQWQDQLTAVGVPASHVRGLDDVVSDEQVLARNMIKPAILGNGRRIQTWGVPVKVNEQLESLTLSVPQLDQHHAEILASLSSTPERPET
jgi:crotonobetainyl-CoA:carnitine CoA-transferase CaiB-like acyl-CoA transferase